MIRKPPDLEAFLASPLLNPTIITWPLHIGLWIEDAIDWVLEPINDIVDWIDLVIAWWEDFSSEVREFFKLLQDNLQRLIEDPVGYLRTMFNEYILPWAIATIPFFATLWRWVTILREELELFFEDPKEYLREKWENHIWPWALEHIPLLSTLKSWFDNFKAELELFFEDPLAYLRHAFEDHILPWAQANIPFLATLYHWFVDLREKIEGFFSSDIFDNVAAFFRSPLDFLLDKFTHWFLGGEG